MVRVHLGRGEGMLLGLRGELHILLFDSSLDHAVEILDTVAQLEIDSLKSLNVFVSGQVGCARLLFLRLLSLEVIIVRISSIVYSLIESIVKLVRVDRF